MRALAPTLALAALALACRGPAVPNLASPGHGIVCLGDSITAGTGAAPDAAYPARLAEILGVPVVNAGVPGDTSAQALRRLDGVLARDPWLVVVELGGNDLLRRVPVAETEANLRHIVQGILDAGAVPLLLEVHGPFGGDHRAMFERLADDLEVPLLAGSINRILRSPELKSDPIHPNAAGYARLARDVARVVAPWIEQRRRLGLAARRAAPPPGPAPRRAA